MTFRLAPGVELRSSGAGRFLVSRRPVRAVRVNDALFRLLSREGAIRAEGPAEARALEALAGAGYLERQGSGAEEGWPIPSVTVIIPVMDRAEELGRCLRSLERVRYPRELLEVIVVDDGSADDSVAVARAHGASVVASGGRGLGPASSRNRGARAARGEILAFVDSDCTASSGWLEELVGRFGDPEVAAVGGRVEGMHVATRLDRYEAQMSSLSLGVRERSEKGGDDTFYLPTCNLLVRKQAFLAAGGFREGMHVGEDVDLAWRLRDRGWRLVYSPVGWVWHEHRNRLGAFLTRRFEYGTSEALLHRLHPARRKRLAVPLGPAVALTLACAAALGGGWTWLVAAGLTVLVDGAAARPRFARQGLRLGFWSASAARLRVTASLGYYLGYHLIRYYSVPLLLTGLLAPRAGALAAGVLVATAAIDYHVRRPSLAFAWFLLFYTGEQLAYGAGAFWGCLRARSFGSYRVMASAKA